MSLDPQARALLDQLAGAPPVHELPVPESRAALETAARAVAGAREAVASVVDLAAPGPDRDVPIRVYHPTGDDRAPALVYFHSGGWVNGTLDTWDPMCRRITNRAACAVVAVDYALAPESRFPVAVEEGHAVVDWLHRAGSSVGIDGDHLGVFGDSAGGNLAAAVALLARDRGTPPIRFQLLVYPVTDRACDTASYSEFGDGYFLTKATMEWCWRQYLPDPADGNSPYASPLRAESLAGLPAAYIVTAECDPIRDEAEAYARRLEAAGVDAALIRYPGQIHGFFTMPGVIDAAGPAIDDAARAVRNAFAGAGQSNGRASQGRAR